jgi:NitT/TauT family transport system substrate-binding protein
MNILRLIATIVCILFLSDATEAKEAKSANEKPAKVSVGVSPATSTAGIFFAQEMGFFKDENLEVEMQVFPTSTAPMIPLLAKGELDVGGGVIAAGLFATSEIEQGGIVLVADKGSARKNFDYLKLMVRKDLVDSGRYKTLKDLKGFRVGVTALGGTSQEATFAMYLAKAGLTPKDVVFMKAGYADANKAFTSKSLDAFVQLEPYVSEAVRLGIAVVVGGVYDIHPNQQSAGIFYSPKFIKERRDISVRFMRAYIRGIRAYLKAFSPDRKKDDFDRGVSILSKWTSVKDRSVYESMIPAGLDPDGKLNMDSVKADVKYYLSQGYLKREPALERFVDTTIVEDALKGPPLK